MQKYPWSDKVPSSFSGIPIKVHPSVLLDYNISWSMINIFSYLHHIELDYHILIETWLLIIGSCSWYSIFPYLQYTFPTLWLLLHLHYETTYQHFIGLIDSQRRGTNHSKSNSVNHLYYLWEIDSFQSLLLQYRHIYTQYSASQRCHCQELISFLIWLF